MSYIQIQTTASSKEEAEKIAEHLVKSKLAACIQTLSIDSKYVWKEKLCNENEILLLIKSKKDNYELIEKEIKRIHSYETPEIISTETILGSKEYFNWIDEVTK